MKLVPQARAIKLSECSPGDFVRIKGSDREVKELLVLAISEGETTYLLLDENYPETPFPVFKQTQDMSVLNYGSDWKLAPFGELLEKHNCFDSLGALILAGGEVYLLGEKVSGFQNRVMCDLNGHDILELDRHPKEFFGYPGWEIYVEDPTLGEKHILKTYNTFPKLLDAKSLSDHAS